jgi:tetratricopeptide (TPR) repeat protein
MKKYLFFVALTVVLLTKPLISNGQLSETDMQLYKARYLHDFNKTKIKAVQDIYNNLIAKEPNNAVIYAESGFFNLTYSGDEELGLVDLTVAMHLLENKLCACDYEHAYNKTKNEFECSLTLLDKIYDKKGSYYYEKKEYDSAAYYANKLINLYTDSSGLKVDYSKFKSETIAKKKLIFLYQDKMNVLGYLHNYQEALLTYHKMIAIDSTRKDNSILIALHAVMGEYDSAIQIIEKEVFVKTNSGMQFNFEYPSLAPEYFYTYLSAYLGKRDFTTAHKLLTDNTTISSVSNTKGKKQQVLLKNYPMYVEGESVNICDRIKEGSFDYLFFNFYTCLLHDLASKNYENALLHLNSSYKIMGSKFSKLAGGIPSTIDFYRYEYNIFSLKGYLLSKLNRKDEAKLAYQEAIKLNPTCKKAKEELKVLQ